MTPIDSLKKLAEAATPGPWMPFQERGVNEILIAGTAISVVHWQGFDAASTELKQQHHDCAYIAAANPQTILALIERCELAEKDAERYRWLRNSANDTLSTAPAVCNCTPDDDQETFLFGAELDAAIDAALTKEN